MSMRTFSSVPGVYDSGRPLTVVEIIVVVVVMVLAAGLTIAGLPMFGIAELLGGTAAVVVRVLRAGRRSPQDGQAG
ncbi:hypothetical protein [Streptomyces fradiae]|uniref:hypothetical protein n=1 Tax=Streptomyces fradiae TaxID=1906 RepID=UPI0039875EE8